MRHRVKQPVAAREEALGRADVSPGGATVVMEPRRYRIILRGRLSEDSASLFEGMSLQSSPDRTVLTGELRDQAQLHGVLERVRDLGIELVGLHEVPR
jgi:hypothetical protein